MGSCHSHLGFKLNPTWHPAQNTGLDHPTQDPRLEPNKPSGIIFPSQNLWQDHFTHPICDSFTSTAHCTQVLWQALQHPPLKKDLCTKSYLAGCWKLNFQYEISLQYPELRSLTGTSDIDTWKRSMWRLKLKNFLKVSEQWGQGNSFEFWVWGSLVTVLLVSTANLHKRLFPYT